MLGEELKEKEWYVILYIECVEVGSVEFVSKEFSLYVGEGGCR